MQNHQEKMNNTGYMMCTGSLAEVNGKIHSIDRRWVREWNDEKYVDRRAIDKWFFDRRSWSSLFR